MESPKAWKALVVGVDWHAACAAAGTTKTASDAQQGREPGAQPSRSKYIRQIRDPLVHVDPRSARVRLIGRQLSRVLETTVADMSRFGLLMASR